MLNALLEEAGKITRAMGGKLSPDESAVAGEEERKEVVGCLGYSVEAWGVKKEKEKRNEMRPMPSPGTEGKKKRGEKNVAGFRMKWGIKKRNGAVAVGEKKKKKNSAWTGSNARKKKKKGRAFFLFRTKWIDRLKTACSPRPGEKKTSGPAPGPTEKKRGGLPMPVAPRRRPTEQGEKRLAERRGKKKKNSGQQRKRDPPVAREKEWTAKKGKIGKRKKALAPRRAESRTLAGGPGKGDGCR